MPQTPTARPVPPLDRSGRAWAIVAASVVILTFGVGGALYLFGVLLTSLAAAFGWARAELAGANSVAMLVMGLLGPLTGRIVERHGPRALMSVGALCCGAGFGCQGLVGSVGPVNEWLSPLGQLYACYALFGLGLAGVGFVPVNTVVAGWFTERRGLALGVISAGIGLGGFLTLPAGWLIDRLGWRAACLVGGATILVVMLPLVLFVITLAPGDAPPAGQGANKGPAGSGASRLAKGRNAWALAAGSGTFWALSVAFAVYTIAVSTVRVFGIVLLEERGYDPPRARFVMTTLAIAGVVGKVLFGYLADRFSPRALAAAAFGLEAAGTLMLLNPQITGFTLLFSTTFGLPMGGLATLQAVLVAQYFGRAAFGTVYGLLIFVLTLGAAAGPVLAGHVYDVGGGYNGTALACAAGCGLGALLVLVRPRSPALAATVAPTT